MERLRDLLAREPYLEGAGAILLVLVACAVAYVVAKRLILRAVEFLVKRSRATWDDVLLRRGIFEKLAYLAPAVVVYYTAYVFGAELQGVIHRLLLAYMLVVILLVLGGLLTAANDLYAGTARARELPIKGYVQIAKLVVYLTGGIVVFATLLDRSPWGVLSGVGAMTAILLLVFKDTILSFVASVQLATNDMVRIGDWISMPQYGADGDVVDIALHTVKVQNWDKTITAIPTHKLIEESFKNWRGMQTSGGRRIKRAVHIDQTSIRFLDEDTFDKLSKLHLLGEYLASKRREVEAHNRAHAIDETHPANGRRLTNIGTFRAYVSAYLKANPNIHREMTFLVRQLEPGPQGLPIEIYVFTNDTRWEVYEGVQADLFDHLLAAVPEFGLRVFQNPTGHDFARLMDKSS